MKVLLTGANGFLGTALQNGLKQITELITLGRSKNVTVVCDLSTQIPALPSIDIVIHAAGKAHIVPKNEEERNDFYTVNVQGTRNLLASLEHNKFLNKFIFISSVSVYGLIEGVNIAEDAPLLASDPYGKSKIEAEKLVSEWCALRNVDYYILRLPLIAGKHAPGNLGAMVKGIRSGRYVSIGKAKAKKSMILADDLAAFIENIQGPAGIYNLTDGYHPSFRELEQRITKFYKKKKIISLPGIAAKILGVAGDIVGSKFPVNSDKIKKITSTLTFSDARAKAQLQWDPREVLKAWEIE